jgi:hypothetical protein
MTSRFFRFAVLFVLLLLTAQVVQPYIFRLMYSATTPKIVVPRGNLSEAEQSTIALFDRVSPSVVQVVGRQSGESAFGDETARAIPRRNRSLCGCGACYVAEIVSISSDFCLASERSQAAILRTAAHRLACWSRSDAANSSPRACARRRL